MPKKVKFKPYPYQREGVRRLAKFLSRPKRGAVLADEMGLGKTAQFYLYALTYVDLTKRPLVVVCQATIKWELQEQAWTHFGVRAEVLSSRKPPRQLKKAQIYIINYEVLAWWVDKLKALKPTVVVYDECQMIKNRGAKRTKAAVKLGKSVRNVIASSGTPIENNPAEFFTVLNLTRPDKFPRFKKFGIRYCAPKKNSFGIMEYTGASRKKELRRKLLKYCMIRRLKKDVVKDLPAKTLTIEPVDLPRMAEYQKAERDMVAWLKATEPYRKDKSRGAERRARFQLLMKLCGELKMPLITEWIDQFQAQTKKKLLTFGWNIAVVQGLKDHYGARSVIINGKVKGIKRKEAIAAFNYDPKVDLFFGNIQAAGAGWSCKSTASVLFVQFPWNPAKLMQAADRVHGVGRGGGEPAFVWLMVARMTVEEDLMSMLQVKGGNIGQILDGKEDAELKVLDKLEDRLLARGLKLHRKGKK